MSIEQIVSCNSCGKEEIVKSAENVSMFGWGGPPGWVTITSIGSYTGGTAILYDLWRKRPDLCCWKCVADYAAGMASEKA